MSIKRLTQSSGEVLPAEPGESDTDEKLVRPAILVHAGAGGKAMRFLSGDGPISFDEKRIRNVIRVHNAMVDRLAADYGGEEKIPLGAFPPILDMHKDESNDRVIGRLTGRLVHETRDVPKVGKGVSCAVARPGITFLGTDAVSRARDGRIYHLSIGIDEKNDSLGETSTVIEPAAPGAMLLGKGKSEVKSPKKEISGMGAKLKRMEAHAKRKVQLAAMKDAITKLVGGIGATQNQIKLTRREGEVTHRLTGLMRSGKLTPAEFKKLDVKKLTALSGEAFETVASSFDAREPVIIPGQRGSTDATDVAELGKSLEKRQLKRLRSETLSDFKRLGKKLGSEHEDEAEKKLSITEEVHPGKDPHSVPGSGGDEEQKMAYMKHMEDMGKHLAAGDIESAKDAHEKAMAYHAAHGMKHMEGGPVGDVKSEDYKKSMDALQGQVDELNTQMARMGGMVEELMGVEKEEGHDLEADDKEEEESEHVAPPAA